MNRSTALLLGLVLLGAAALFPPLRPNPTAAIPSPYRSAGLGRAILFLPSTYNLTITVTASPSAGSGEHEFQIPSEINVGQLLAEALIVVAIFGSVALVLPDRRMTPA